MKKSWLVCCLINFCIAALMGLILRYEFISPIKGINFQFLLHGHSHVAMLGWLYLALYSLIIHFYISKNEQEKPIYNRLFWITQFSIISMMIRFPIEGYAALSITFSTLHIFCSYYFAYLIWKKATFKSVQEKKIIRTSLFFMIFSTLGVWCLGPAVGLMGKTSIFYQISIQFFLHFQFNGWFFIAIIGLFFSKLKNINLTHFNLFYNLLIISTILTFSFPVSWYIKNSILYWINFIGVLTELASFYFLIMMIQIPFNNFYSKKNKLTKRIYFFVIASLLLKITIHLMTFIPEITLISHQIRNFVIGFIHLNMLGIMSGFIFISFIQINFINSNSNLTKIGINLFLISYVTTEICLFLKGLLIYFDNHFFNLYTYFIFISSMGLPLSIFFLICNQINLKHKL